MTLCHVQVSVLNIPYYRILNFSELLSFVDDIRSDCEFDVVLDAVQERSIEGIVAQVNCFQ